MVIGYMVSQQGYLAFTPTIGFAFSLFFISIRPELSNQVKKMGLKGCAARSRTNRIIVVQKLFPLELPPCLFRRPWSHLACQVFIQFQFLAYTLLLPQINIFLQVEFILNFFSEGILACWLRCTIFTSKVQIILCKSKL